MERVINLLYDIEEKANQIVTRANEEKSKLHDKLQRDMDLYDKKIAEENDLKLKVLKVQADKELNQEKQALIDDCTKHIILMEENYQRNHSSLADKIVREILHSKE